MRDQFLVMHRQILAMHSQLFAKHSQILATHGQILATRGQKFVTRNENLVTRDTIGAAIKEVAAAGPRRAMRRCPGRDGAEDSRMRAFDRAITLPTVYEICRISGYEPPFVCTPQELMGDLSNA